ncbi:asparagine synthase (glutamine-hydrolyzing) [Fibrobacterota bacterium]
MCGVGAYISKAKISQTKIDGILATLNNLQGHRGPDHSGAYSDKNIGLCHTRLSIIDLSSKAHQPFISQGKYIISYNGEVYNYPELKKELLALGHVFTSESDTEVVLRSYIEWGVQSFLKFNGMFAFVIYDKNSNKIIAARDRLGIKPVHFYVDDDKIMFASEVKAILEIQNSRYKEDAVNEILMCGHMRENMSLFEGVQSLRPGQVCEIDLSNFAVTAYAYHNIFKEIVPDAYLRRKTSNIASFAPELEGLIKKSVRNHMISDAPLGVLCSGGLDSSLITAMATNLNSKTRIYHAGVEDGDSEQKYAEQVARHLKIDISYIHMNRQMYLESLVDVIYHLETPIYHPSDISLYQICKLANSQGVKVLLCGEGADELFGGYSWQINFAKQIRLHSKLNSPPLKYFKSLLFKYIHFSDELIDDYLCSAGLFQPYGYKSNYMLMKNYSLLYNRGENLKTWNQIADAFNFLPEKSEIAGNAILMDNLLGHLSTILYRNDRMGMMASIENRVPFIENNIINFALNLPFNHKIQGNNGKKILKHVSEKYLPKSIVYRKKAGFPVPWTKYLSYSDLIFKDGFVEEHFQLSPPLIKRLVTNDPFLLFRLLNIEIWGRIFIRNEDRIGIRNFIYNKSQL